IVSAPGADGILTVRDATTYETAASLGPLPGFLVDVHILGSDRLLLHRLPPDEPPYIAVWAIGEAAAIYQITAACP
ncbi:MAG: hypothetical protein ACFB51_09385, partial [Anaerolineae bacterium]